MATMQRSSFQLIRGKYKKRGKGNVRLTQSSLILLQPLSADSKSYTFQLLETEGAPLPTEIRLNINDEFTCYDVGYYLFATRSLQGAPAPVKISTFWFPYSPVELQGSLHELDEAWNSRMTISINNIKRLENWDMQKHKVVPRTQYANFTVGVVPATTPSIDYKTDGCIIMQPMITFSGAKKNEVTINCVTSITGSGVFSHVTASGTILYAITHMLVSFRGMLAQNAAKFQ